MDVEAGKRGWRRGERQVEEACVQVSQKEWIDAQSCVVKREDKKSTKRLCEKTAQRKVDKSAKSHDLKSAERKKW